jgi:hypothetical protein
MRSISYLDFDIQIQSTESGYRSRVLKCPAGEASGSFGPIFSETELENLSEPDFWNEDTYRLNITTFRLAVKNVLERDPDTAIAALLEWLKDTMKLESSSHSEATVSDVACGILYHSASRWLDPIVDGLPRIPDIRNVRYLLIRIDRQHQNGEFISRSVLTAVAEIHAASGVGQLMYSVAP